MEFKNHIEYLESESNKTKKFLVYKENYLEFIKDNWFSFNKNGYSKLTPYKFQENIIKEIQKNKTVDVIAHSRQMGISGLLCAYIACYLIMNSEKNVVIMSYNLESSINLLNKVKLILNSYVLNGIFDLNNDLIIDNKKTLCLKNGCRVSAMPANCTSLKGRNTDLLFIDNAAFIKNLDDILNLSIPTMSCRQETKILISSTPFDESYFNKIALDLKEYPRDDSTISNIPWDLHPERNLLWFNNESKRLGYRQNYIDSELNCIIKYKQKSNKDKTISLRLPFDLHQKIKLKIGEEKSLSDYIRNLIDNDLADPLKTTII